MDFETVIKTRTSTRLFSKKSLEEEKLLKILEAGRIAPTAKNKQPIKIYVVTSNEGLKKIDKATVCRYKSPCVLIICADKDKAYEKKYFKTDVIDASIVTTHMMLMATSIGVDNIWVEYFDDDKIMSSFDIPNNLFPVALLNLGYKSKLCPPSPFHNIRKKLDDLVVYK